jgi:hypothetical protein
MLAFARMHDGGSLLSKPNQLLFSVEDVRVNRDIEIFTETYFVSLGYAADPGADGCTAVTNNCAHTVRPDELELITPSNVALAKWFHITTSPIFRIRRHRKHTFVGGLPLYFGSPGTISSVYLAVLEGDRRARQAGQSIRQAMEVLPTEGVFQALGALSHTGSPPIALVKQAFGLVIKVVEQALLNNRDDIQYTNVFTFKESNDYLRGNHIVGNQKVTLEVSVETI